MSTSPARPYLDWLDHDAEPPLWLSLRGWQLAAGELVARMRQARKRLMTREASWEDVEQILVSDTKFDALNVWAEYTHERTPRVHRDSFKPAELRLGEARMRFWRGSARSRAIHVLRGWLRRRKQPLTTEQKRLVGDMVTLWKESLSEKLRPETEKLAAQHYRRATEFSNECRELGVWLTRRQASDLDPVWRKRARAAARAQGYAGWFVTADGDDGKRAFECISDRPLREALWRQRQALRESDNTVVPMLRARRDEAVECRHNSYAHLHLYERTLTSPRMIQGVLSEHLDSLGAAIRRVDARVVQEGLAWGIDEVQPWDRPFLLEQLRRKMRFSEEPKNIFHIERTLEVMVPEIMALGGWTVEEALLHDEGGTRQWQYRLQRADGARAHMLIAPFATRDEEDPNEAAVHTFVRHPWNGMGPRAAAVSTIEMRVPRRSQHFDYQQIIWLVHEMGHSLHYLAMRGDTCGEESRFPDDLVEFPSQLLERYGQDPQVLARWAAAGGGPAITHRPSFWRYHLATHLDGFDDHLKFVYSAWIDMMAHRKDPDKVSLQDIHRAGCERFGLPYHDDDRYHFRSFMWGDYAATDYAYPLGLAIGNELAPRRADNTIDAAALGENFSELLEEVLTDGFEPKRLRRSWQQWRGEDVATSLRRGMKKQVAYIRLISKALAALP